MLSIAAMGHASASYYSSLAREDYYTQGGEPPGIWFGKGSERLILHDHIQAGELRAVFEGLSPDRTFKLTQNGGTDAHHPGWDLTFSAPKSVSVYWSQADRTTRSAIEHCVLNAAMDSLRYLEANACFTRRGKGGHIIERTEGIVIALYPHSTSRSQDPQLHIHALVFNAALRKDGTWGALLGMTTRKGEKYSVTNRLPFFNEKMTAGALFQASLANSLQEDLKLSVKRTAIGFELIGIPKPVLEHFSTRRREIKEELSELGQSDAKTSARAALNTRPKKSAVPREELFKSWQQRASKLGYQNERVKTHEFRAARLEDITTAVKNRIEDRSLYITHSALTRELAFESIGKGIALDSIHQSVKQLLSDKHQFVPIHNSPRLEPRFLTAQQAKQTARANRHLFELKQQRGARAAANAALSKAHRSLLRQGIELSEKQNKLLETLTKQNSSVRVLNTSSNKEALPVLEAARIAWSKRQLGEKTGLKIIAVSPNVSSAKMIQGMSGIKSYTPGQFLKAIAPKSHAETLAVMSRVEELIERGKRDEFRTTRSYLKYAERVKASPWCRLDRKTIVVVDKPEMIHPELRAEIYQAAKNARATVVLRCQSKLSNDLLEQELLTVASPAKAQNIQPQQGLTHGPSLS